jgi:RNA polymerase sigma-70 factor (ECF subfamily)
MLTRHQDADDSAPVLAEDGSLLAALRAGDERAFTALVRQYHTSLVRVARAYVRSHAVAEEVAQETWLGVLRGLDRFEGRSSLKTWIFQILTNRAKTRGEREQRSRSFSSTASPGTDDDTWQPAVDPDRFLPADHPQWPGGWSRPPVSWEDTPEERFLSRETRAMLDQAIAGLPEQQQAVIRLRDIEGWTTAEVCNVLGIAETHQRVLLHRARSKVRQALAEYLGKA